LPCAKIAKNQELKNRILFICHPYYSSFPFFILEALKASLLILSTSKRPFLTKKQALACRYGCRNEFKNVAINDVRIE